MSKGGLKIAKKSTYQVEYTSEIPDGTTALISYQDKDNVRHVEKHHKGNFNKTVELSSGQGVKFTIDVKLPKTDSATQLVTTIKVDDEVINAKT
ncbi:hypothetical protein NAF17_02360 [Mucilaginibacter sp. RB4R14]|uniref:hypothetical protein n=1 Tax=Mucilaginibacter aurantiaciroseus TaxID=2949308 RepID=UPI002091C795|nr:hypothetical protein [Mucilaginibacter aurantiaciroseus]MCO5934370.1 hypothetical protein [Mucilaginibacter aurantiaciroseus]